jgi:hypothetical protein
MQKLVKIGRRTFKLEEAKGTIYLIGIKRLESYTFDKVTLVCKYSLAHKTKPLFEKGGILELTKLKVFTIDLTARTKVVKALAKTLDLKYVDKIKYNGYGGTSQHSRLVTMDISGKVTILCTCRNCGEGTSVDISKIVDNYSL